MPPSPQPVTSGRDGGSFRDPSGFVFRRDGALYRQINRVFEPEWRAFLTSGLYDRLATDRLIVTHEEAPLSEALSAEAVAVIRPSPVGFISYPYEWAFSQLKDAALLTLRAQEMALAKGFTLRDASAYNVQFAGGAPILIDSLSFAPAQPDRPWEAYRQFCQHFLAPLALAAYRDPRLLLLQREFLDGIPVDLASLLLPARTRLNVGLASHIHLTAGAQKRAARAPRGARPGSEADARAPRMSATRQLALLDNLRRTVEGLRWELRPESWSAYTTVTSYEERAAASKRSIVERFLGETSGRWVWDLGANTGTFSRIAAGMGRSALALDNDPSAVEQAYREVRRDGEKGVLPLLLDLSSPSPALGWALQERRSILERANADVVLALALVHHVAIGNNVPLPQFASFLAALGPELIVEFVPKEDPMVQRLLSTRTDVFPDYSIDGFRSAFEREFEIGMESPIEESRRTLFLMRRR